MMKRIFVLWISLMLLLGAAAAEMPEAPEAGVTVNDISLELLGNTLHYPQLSGLEDEAVMQAVNEGIMSAGQIEARINRMAALLSLPVKMQVSYVHTLAGDVFSCAILAEGAVETTGSTQVWSAVNVDLRTGDAFGLDALFTDAQAARAHMESYLQKEVAPELSAYLENGELLPLPETFSLSREGLTLYYPIDQFCTLSGRAGTVTLLWTELREHLNLGEGSPLTALGVEDTITLDENDTREDFTAALADGGFPGVPAVIGQSVRELTDRYAQQSDYLLCEGGRMFVLEDGAFRHIWIITDKLGRSWDRSTVQFLRADRLNLKGLCTGTTTTEQWRSVLGEPDASAVTDAASADSWRIVPGSSDYYTLGEYILRLHADEEGVLRSVFLLK